VEIAKIQEAGKKGQDNVINDLLTAVFEAHPAPVV
jgi:V-type H+-transporting ATPase subunit G